MAFENKSKDELERLYYLSYLNRTDPKLAVSGTVDATGPTTLITPAPGATVEIYWVYALTDPDSPTSPLITIRIGGRAIYAGYAISHTEVFRGLPDETVTITLSESATVAVTIHYREF